MSSSFEDQISALMAEVAKQRKELAEAKKDFEKATVSATSKDHLVEVTLSLNGRVKDVKFHRTDYAAMPPAQLSAVLVETLNVALEKVTAKGQEAFGTHAAFGAELRESLIGGSEVNDVFEGMGSLFEMFDTGTKKPSAEPDDDY